MPRQFSFAAQSVSSAAFPLRAPDGTAAAPSYSFSTQTGTGFWMWASGTIAFASGGSSTIAFKAASVDLASGQTLGWSSSDPTAAGSDLVLNRIAANVLGIKDGSSAQEIRIFGSATKYASLTHNNTITILSDSGGSGVRVSATGANLGFYGTAPVALQTGVAATATAVRAVLINLGLCT